MFFEKSKCPVNKKLDNFSNYVRRQSIARFLAYYEIFKLQMNVKGSIVECGVYNGGGVMNWAKISSTLEPYNYHRKIIAFDTFEGFPDVSSEDIAKPEVKAGMFNENYDIYDELKEVIKEYNENRFINHIEKIELVKGDAKITIPKYIEDNKHLVISLLFLDFDLYEPTKSALEYFLPLMPKGAILAFDELNNKDWPGETKALREKLNLNDYELKCFEFEPNISYIKL